MNSFIHYLALFKTWYERRPLREQGLTLLLFLSVVYALFSFFFFSHLDKKIIDRTAKITAIKQKNNAWQVQIEALNKIASSPLYLKWSKHHEYFTNLKKQYNLLLRNSSSKEWQDVITTLLKSQPNITLVQITSAPETLYKANDTTQVVNRIYEQTITLSIESNYFDTMTYVKKLEDILPNIYWKRLSYNVTAYPTAKVDLEFSIIYEKSN